MKKLMIAAAIVCAAVVGQAASVSWDVDWVYSNNGTTVDTFGDGSSVSYWVVNMLSATDTSGLSIDKYGNLVNTAGYSVVGTGSIDTMGSGSAEGTIANGNYLAMVVYDAANGLYGISDAAAVSGIVAEPPTAGGIAGRVFQNDGGSNPDSAPYMVANTPIPTSPVPEPTSGLLMLLGVAGLALKRKRA